MKFKDLKQGYPLFVLDKGSMTYYSEKVVSVSLPHADAKMTAMGMVVDITTDKATYCVIADSEIAYPQNKTMTTDRINILREVEALRTSAEQALSQIDSHRQMVTKCNQLIADLDPAQKEKQQTEARFASLESRLDKLMTILEKGHI